MWNLFVGKGRFVKEIAPGDVSRVARALGALGDWKEIVVLLQSMTTEGGGLLPPLNRVRCVRTDGRAGPGALPALVAGAIFWFRAIPIYISGYDFFPPSHLVVKLRDVDTP